MFNFKLNYVNLIKIFLLTFLTTISFSQNLIYFFISWVGLNIALYGILLAGRWANNSVTEMVVKYFIVGVMLTVFFLFTMTLFAINYMTFNTDTLSYIILKDMEYGYLINLNLTQKLFYVTIISLFLFKLGAFPFHFYLSDVYSALDLHRNMQIYTITLKVFILLAMFNTISQFWYICELFYPLLVVSAIGSMFIGAFSALSQFNFKRFLAFSYLNSVGFVLLGLATGLSFGFGAITFFGAKVYFVSYVFAWGLILLALRIDGLLAGRAWFKQNEGVYYITDLSAVSLLTTTSKIYGPMSFFNTLKNLRLVGLVIGFTSLMGLPPTIGFFGKTVVYLGLIGAKAGLLLLIVTLVLTPVMAFSYLRVLLQILYPNKKILGQKGFELVSQDVFVMTRYGSKHTNLILKIVYLNTMLIFMLLLVLLFPILWINYIVF